jgi:hypothetical protein
MRYFYYTNTYTGISTVIIFDENSVHVTLYPERPEGYSRYKCDWLNYYENLSPEEKKCMYEICENQFRKFKEHGTIPNNWDW